MFSHGQTDAIIYSGECIQTLRLITPVPAVDSEIFHLYSPAQIRKLNLYECSLNEAADKIPSLDGVTKYQQISFDSIDEKILRIEQNVERNNESIRLLDCRCRELYAVFIDLTDIAAGKSELNHLIMEALVHNPDAANSLCDSIREICNDSNIDLLSMDDRRKLMSFTGLVEYGLDHRERYEDIKISEEVISIFNRILSIIPHINNIQCGIGIIQSMKKVFDAIKEKQGQEQP